MATKLRDRIRRLVARFGFDTGSRSDTVSERRPAPPAGPQPEAGPATPAGDRVQGIGADTVTGGDIVGGIGEEPGANEMPPQKG